MKQSVWSTEKNKRQGNGNEKGNPFENHKGNISNKKIKQKFFKKKENRKEKKKKKKKKWKTKQKRK